MLQVEAIARGPLSVRFHLPRPEISCPGQSGNRRCRALVDQQIQVVLSMRSCGQILLPQMSLMSHRQRLMQNISLWIVSVSVYYVAVRTIVLSRHGSNLAWPVIIHDIIHGLIRAKYSMLWIFRGLAGWKLRLRPLRFFYVQFKVSQTSHLIYVVLWAPRVSTAPGSHIPSNYEPGATLLNLSDRAQTVERTPYSVSLL